MFPAFCRKRLAVLQDYRYFLRIGSAQADNVYALVWAERCLALALSLLRARVAPWCGAHPYRPSAAMTACPCRRSALAAQNFH